MDRRVTEWRYLERQVWDSTEQGWRTALAELSWKHETVLELDQPMPQSPTQDQNHCWCAAGKIVSKGVLSGKSRTLHSVSSGSGSKPHWLLTGATGELCSYILLHFPSDQMFRSNHAHTQLCFCFLFLSSHFLFILTGLGCSVKKPNTNLKTFT